MSSPSFEESDSTVRTENTASDRVVVVDSRFSCNICFEAVNEPVVTQCGHLYCWSCLYKWLEPGIYPSERQMLGGGVAASMSTVNESRRCCPVCKTNCSIPTIVPIYVRNEPPTPEQQRKQRGEQQQQQQQRNTGADREDQETNQPVADELDIDDTAEPENNIREENPGDEDDIYGPPPEQEEENTTTGLRRRLRFRSHDSEISDVPSRPGPTTPPRQYNNNNPARSPPPPVHYHRPPLSHGLAHSLWQSLATSTTGDQPIPSLHYRQPVPQQQQAVDDDASEFLWRLLLMLGSFVVLCLLIF